MIVHIFVSNDFSIVEINTVKTISDYLHLVTMKFYCKAEGYYFASKNIMKAAGCLMLRDIFCSGANLSTFQSTALLCHSHQCCSPC